MPVRGGAGPEGAWQGWNLGWGTLVLRSPFSEPQSLPWLLAQRHLHHVKAAVKAQCIDLLSTLHPTDSF